jgi:hypothetical protein
LSVGGGSALAMISNSRSARSDTADVFSGDTLNPSWKSDGIILTFFYA